ncbi:chemotaxis protein CheD [Nostoc sp. NIES-2111]
MPKKTHVHIGEFHCASKGTLQAVLGSCVGVAIWHKKRDLVGLAHCLLPEAPLTGGGEGARYVDTGILNMLHRLGWIRMGDQVPRGWRAVIAGGNHVTPYSGNSQLDIGAKNLDSARRLLQELRIPFEEATQPSNHGCLIEINCLTRSFRTESLAPKKEALACR